MIVITSKKDGFRRCGIVHPARATEHPDGTFTKEQVAVLDADPMLTVVVSEDAKADTGKGKTQPKA